MADARCEKKISRYSTCGGRLDTTTDALGRVAFTCPLCARQAAGVCRECPHPVVGKPGKALRCAVCAQRARRAAVDRYRQEHMKRLRMKSRRYARAHRAERNEYNRLYRAARPEKSRQWAAEYREKNREHVRQYARTYRALHGDCRADAPRPCLDGCGTIVTGRAKLCAPCRKVRRQAARAVLTARLQRIAA